MRVKDAASGSLPPRLLLAGFVLCIGLGALVQWTVPGAWLDDKLLDAQMHMLKHFFPTHARNEVVLVGIDETDLRQFPEPIALWHPHMGAFLHAVAEGHAAAVGVDMALPERSYDAIVPGYDQSLISGILSARRALPTVMALTLDARGNVRAVDSRFRLVAGDDGMGLAMFPRDVDGVVRRFDERLTGNGVHVLTLVGQMMRGMGRTADPGIIDFSRGDDFDYLPFRTVLAWSRAKDTASLRSHFEGKAVMLGSVLQAADRVRMPINLAAWEGKDEIPAGVLLHAQTLRLLLDGGLVRPLSPWSVLCLIAVAAMGWFAGLRPIPATAAFIIGSCLVFTADAALFRGNWYIPMSGILASAFLALAARAAVDASSRLEERHLLQRAFSASVSPGVMKEILDGTLSPPLGGERRYVCILCSDIHGFATRSESMPPEAAIRLLNRTFDRVVAAVHAEGGTVVNSMGDGITAIFGAPKALPDPCRSGFDAARAMHDAVAKLNEVLAHEGLAPIEIGVGLHAGDAVVGTMGATIRNDYTAIGDVANVASRVEGLTGTVGCRVVCTGEVARALGQDEKLAPLGPQAIEGHAPVDVYGWGRL
ncbi:MAG TPA: adenylate/guanylate cyclase domain-containing protein [Xanthomonadaceae bacterium]|nr:adenylate/guanylate cyclase domain-containing protein [Xanthomonadaceae bacterium]